MTSVNKFHERLPRECLGKISHPYRVWKVYKHRFSENTELAIGRTLRFWFGGNLERELGEAFSPPQFTVKESEVSDQDFFCVRVNVRKWQAAPSCFFVFFVFFCFAFGRPSIDRNGSHIFVPSFFLLIFSLNPFINLLVMV